MEDKKFKMIDEEFICENCGRKVETLKYTARDHCPYCLYSKHVDINPGDRKNTCLGVLVPFSVEKFKKGFKIIYKCQKCGQIKKNIMAIDDDMDMVIKLSVNG